MNKLMCSAEPCPVLLSSSCVFYEGPNLVYTNINTNDTLEKALEKINNILAQGGGGGTATIEAGAGISISTIGGVSTITNSSPDLTVNITGSGGTSVTGTYPNFNIDSSNLVGVSKIIGGSNVNVSPSDGTGIVTLSAVNTIYTAGSGISLSGTQFSNSAPDKTVVLNEGSNITITGTYPNFTISSVAGGEVDSVNGKTGQVILNTNDIPEGTTNLYDKTVTITGSGSTNVTGTYPNFNIETIDEKGVESIVAGQGIDVNSSDIANPIVSNSGALSVNTKTGNVVLNTDDIDEGTTNLYDKTVSITGTGAAIVTGIYPTFNIDVEEGEMTKDSFVGNGIQTNFQLSVTPISATYTEVFLSGVYQESSTYTLSGNTVIFSSAPEAGDTLEIVTFNLGPAGGQSINTDDFVTNVNDVYSSVGKVTNIISLTQSEYNGLASGPDENTIYVIVG